MLRDLSAARLHAYCGRGPWHIAIELPPDAKLLDCRGRHRKVAAHWAGAPDLSSMARKAGLAGLSLEVPAGELELEQSAVGRRLGQLKAVR